MSQTVQTSSRAKRLREQLLQKQTTILMEAHNGLSAKLAAEAGFTALWASGLSRSAALGVRDNNEASWTQVLEVLEFMSDATDLPILLDGDTGYGNFNNVRRLVRKLEQRNIAGVCLEDTLFPKTNSFIGGEKQALAEVDEFCGKMRAAKDTQVDPNFVVVARTEAFIAGWGLEEALLRATAYADNGADAILVHSKRSDSQEILAFMSKWDRRVPIVIVPTKYPSEPLSKLVDAGVSNFIFANHALRSGSRCCSATSGSCTARRKRRRWRRCAPPSLSRELAGAGLGHDGPRVPQTFARGYTLAHPDGLYRA